MKVLLIQEKSEIRDYLQFALSAFDEVHLSVTGSVSQAIDYLHSDSEISCIFIGNKVTQDSDPKELLTKIISYCSNNQTILIGTNKGLQEYLGNKYIPPMASIVAINRKIKETLNLDTSVLNLDHFISVPFEVCAKLKILPCDLHFKIGSGEQTKHIKRYIKGSQIDTESLREYRQKNLINVYVKKEDYETIEKLLKRNADSTAEINLNSFDNISDNYFNSLRDSIDYGSFIINSSGMVGFDTNKTHLLAKKLQSQVENLSTSEKSNIEEMFRLSLISKDNLDLKINSLCSIIASNLINQYTWGTTDMVEMLMYASAFHNIGLSGNTDLITVIKEEEYDLLKPEQKALIDHHAAYSSSIVSTLDFIHPNVKKLIKEQHGFIDGEVFIGEKQNTSNFTAMFRIVSELATEFIKEFELSKEEFNAFKVIQSERIRNNNDYPEIYDALTGCIPKELIKPI